MNQIQLRDLNLKLPNELIDIVISFLPPHPNALSIKLFCYRLKQQPLWRYFSIINFMNINRQWKKGRIEFHDKYGNYFKSIYNIYDIENDDYDD